MHPIRDVSFPGDDAINSSSKRTINLEALDPANYLGEHPNGHELFTTNLKVHNVELLSEVHDVQVGTISIIYDLGYHV